MKQRIYLAGPMTGKPSFNIPAFDAATEDLRLRGFDVVSPAELDDPELRAEELASPDGNIANLTGAPLHGELLTRDLAIIMDGGIDAIWVLPGWERSGGARLETFTAKAIKGLPIMEYDNGQPVSGWRLMKAWVGREMFRELILAARMGLPFIKYDR